MKHHIAMAALLAAAVVAGCGTAAPPQISRVLLISVDGLRPDLLLEGHSPEMTSLMQRGSYTLLARTVTEGYTVPSHVSMLTGVVPARHGVTWDHHVEDSYPNVATLFELAKKAGYSTALVAGKTKLIVLTKPGTLDWSYVANESNEDDAAVAGHAAAMLREHKPAVMFVHFAGVDVAGHAAGWGSPKQFAAVAQVDRAVGAVLRALEETGLDDQTLVIVTSDHGGWGLLHPPDNPYSQRIPWIASGPGVRKNFNLVLTTGRAVDTMTTFATACAVLRIAVPDQRDGTPVTEIFENRRPP